MLWHRGDDAALVADAQLQSRITHGHVRAQVACAFYCLWARRIADGASDPWAAAAAGLRALYPRGSDERAVLEEHIRPDEPAAGSGSGYVIDCLRSARLALGAGYYAAVVRAAIRLGDDTDTTACVAGGLAGLRDGVAAIPPRWRAALRGTELLAPLLDALHARAA
jgi:ADP-ribosylglycohydrolase